MDTKNRNGEMWVVLKIRSAAVVGNVAIEEDKKDAGAVIIKMKLLAQPYYNVWVGGDSINLTILKP